MTLPTSPLRAHTPDPAGNYSPPTNIKKKRFRILVTQESYPTRTTSLSNLPRPGASYQPVSKVVSPPPVHGTLRKTSSAGNIGQRKILQTPREETPASPLRLSSSPRWRKVLASIIRGSEPTFLEAASAIKPDGSLTTIRDIKRQIEELTQHLNKLGEEQIKGSIQWRGQAIIPKESDLEDAISFLEEILNHSWESYINYLWNCGIVTDQFKVGDSVRHTLKTVHGEEVEFTLVKELEAGGSNYSYIVCEISGRESVLLVGKQHEEPPNGDSAWRREQIESILWRENISTKFKSENFFPFHYYTFVAKAPDVFQPTACYMIEKLDPLDTIEDRIGFCERLTKKMDQLHARNCVHGDVTPGNILTRDDEPVLIDLDPFCFVDFNQLEQMNPTDLDKQLEKMQFSGITSLFSPPEFQTKFTALLRQKNLNGLQDYLQLKDRYGLALFIWEFCRERKVAKLETESALTEASLQYILSTTRKSRKLSSSLKEWIQKELTEGFERFPLPKSDSFSTESSTSGSRTSSLSNSPPSLPETSIPKQSFFDVAY